MKKFTITLAILAALATLAYVLMSPDAKDQDGDVNLTEYKLPEEGFSELPWGKEKIVLTQIETLKSDPNVDYALVPERFVQGRFEKISVDDNRITYSGETIYEVAEGSMIQYQHSTMNVDQSLVKMRVHSEGSKKMHDIFLDLHGKGVIREEVFHYEIGGQKILLSDWLDKERVFYLYGSQKDQRNEDTIQESYLLVYNIIEGTYSKIFLKGGSLPPVLISVLVQGKDLYFTALDEDGEVEKVRCAVEIP